MMAVCFIPDSNYQKLPLEPDFSGLRYWRDGFLGGMSRSMGPTSASYAIDVIVSAAARRNSASDSRLRVVPASIWRDEGLGCFGSPAPPFIGKGPMMRCENGIKRRPGGFYRFLACKQSTIADHGVMQ